MDFVGESLGAQEVIIRRKKTQEKVRSQISEQEEIKRNAFNYIISDKDIYTTLIQAVLADCQGSNQLFDRNGVFLPREQSGISDLLWELIELTPYYKRHEKDEDFLGRLDSRLGSIIEKLYQEPNALHPHKSNVAYGFRNDLEGLLLGSGLEVFSEDTRKAVREICPSDIKHLKSGNYNAVYHINCPELASYVIAIRMPHANPKRSPRPKPYDSQFEIHTKIYEAMSQVQEQNKQKKYAKIPKPYFSTPLGPQTECLVMEKIEGAVELAEFVENKSNQSLLPEILEILKNTLEYWKTGNQGSILFKHNDLHMGNVLIKTKNIDGRIQVEDVFIIDFDFSRYDPLSFPDETIKDVGYIEHPDESVIGELKKRIARKYTK